jgi:hypothetical protein
VTSHDHKILLFNFKLRLSFTYSTLLQACMWVSLGNLILIVRKARQT